MSLFEPIKIGRHELNNRFVMAPLTRCRAPGHIPTDVMAEHYAQRASAGLIIAEATLIQEGTSGYWKDPGIYAPLQIAGWKKVTDAVHAKGGKIFLQMCHAGRIAHPLNNNGLQPVAPSAIKMSHRVSDEHNPSGSKVEYVVPRALDDSEIPSIVEMFVNGAKNALAAGFDGVEVHGANGYLLDQFLRESTNKRTGPYGGPIENRARLLLEVVKAVCEAIGGDNVGLRLSPLNSFHDMKDSDPEGLVAYVCEQLNPLNLAFLHVMRSDFMQQQHGNVLGVARKVFTGTLISNMGYEIDEANEAIASKEVDAIAFGTKFIANPDLVERAKAGAALNPLRMEHFYFGDALYGGNYSLGYTDYPFM